MRNRAVNPEDGLSVKLMNNLSADKALRQVLSKHFLNRHWLLGESFVKIQEALLEAISRAAAAPLSAAGVVVPGAV